ncbi:hypothetical protein GCM10009546_66220 [Actinomadura livida]|uniref:XRE family transcriptional regulator n=1 Tax=Actinomadura livida TaxID=79909 RepID=A0ABN1FNX2_9ACTN|nr:hypothetical protein GCM10010208_23900 [Actinomadura livida]
MHCQCTGDALHLHATYGASKVDVVENWTGSHASALQRATRTTNEGFAGRLGVSVRTVAKWNANPGMPVSVEL